MESSPKLVVSRGKSACKPCRTAKTSCDGKLPVCSACVKKGKSKECASSTDQMARGTERSYVSALEGQIERLKKQLAAFDNFSPGQVSGPDPRKKTHRKEASDVEDLVSDFGGLSINATASGYYRFNQAMSFARLVQSTAGNERMPEGLDEPLPPRELANNLFQEYMRRVFSLYPVLTETDMYGALENAYQFDGHFCKPQQTWTVRMILAIALLCRSREKNDANYRSAVGHASFALRQSEHIMQPGSIKSIQSFLLLTIYAMLDPTHFSSWYLIGVASRIMVDIGMHQEPPEEQRVAPHHLELRRRIFYCVYSLNRLISISLRRNFCFTDNSHLVELPAPSPLLFDSTIDYSTSFVDSATELVKFRKLQSLAYQSVFGSSREVQHMPWRQRVGHGNGARAEAMNLPDTFDKPLQHLVRAEMFFLDSLLILPPLGNRSLDAEGLLLAFDFLINFARESFCIFKSNMNLSYCTYMEYVRVLHIGHELLSLLEEPDPQILLGIDNYQRPNPNEFTAIPQPPRTTPPQRLSLAITALIELSQIFEYLCCKLEGPGEENNFRIRCGSCLKNLQAKSNRVHATQYSLSPSHISG